MNKLSPIEFDSALVDVRKAYRLIATYQERIMDTIKYCGNYYGMVFSSGWSKFSSTVSGGNRAKIDKTSWSWLPMYFYEFNMGVKKIDGNEYHFKILHQADTGYYDTNKNHKIPREDTEKFGDVRSSVSRLYFILSKNKSGCPIKNLLEEYKTKDSKQVIFTNDWLAVAFPLRNFLNEDSAKIALARFDQVCLDEFKIKLSQEKTI
ncbi:hypothetical protein [Croceibacter atlanticus]|uniref:hypothetical protein n=1 Tax=Croceibacter atlanticus TaxID=313588 RepID=UPI0030FAD765